MDKPTDILKVRYTLRIFDLDFLSSYRQAVYELHPSGKVVYCRYEKGSTRAIEKNETHNATEADYQKLCSDLNDCINSADRLNSYADDCSVDIKIYRPFSRTETMDRGYGNEITDVGRIVNGYISGAARVE